MKNIFQLNLNSFLVPSLVSVIGTCGLLSSVEALATDKKGDFSLFQIDCESAPKPKTAAKRIKDAPQRISLNVASSDFGSGLGWSNTNIGSIRMEYYLVNGQSSGSSSMQHVSEGHVTGNVVRTKNGLKITYNLGGSYDQVKPVDSEINFPSLTANSGNATVNVGDFSNIMLSLPGQTAKLSCKFSKGSVAILSSELTNLSKKYFGFYSGYISKNIPSEESPISLDFVKSVKASNDLNKIRADFETRFPQYKSTSTAAPLAKGEETTDIVSFDALISRPASVTKVTKEAASIEDFYLKPLTILDPVEKAQVSVRVKLQAVTKKDIGVTPFRIHTLLEYGALTALKSLVSVPNIASLDNQVIQGTQQCAYAKYDLVEMTDSDLDKQSLDNLLDHIGITRAEYDQSTSIAMVKCGRTQHTMGSDDEGNSIFQETLRMAK